jgi:hypothetical protein
MHKVCARMKFDVSWFYYVLQDERIPMTTNLQFLDGQNKRYELNKIIDMFDSIWKWFQIDYWNYEILWH